MTMLHPTLKPGPSPESPAPDTEPSALPLGFQPTPEQAAVQQAAVDAAQARDRAVPSVAESVAAAEVIDENRAAARIMADVAALPEVGGDVAETVNAVMHGNLADGIVIPRARPEPSVADEQAAQVRRTANATADRLEQGGGYTEPVKHGRVLYPLRPPLEQESRRLRLASLLRQRDLLVNARDAALAATSNDTSADAKAYLAECNDRVDRIERQLYDFGHPDALHHWSANVKSAGRGLIVHDTRSDREIAPTTDLDTIQITDDEGDTCVSVLDAAKLLTLASLLANRVQKKPIRESLDEWAEQLLFDLMNGLAECGWPEAKRPEWSPL